jgi:hypothetical protein
VSPELKALLGGLLAVLAGVVLLESGAWLAGAAVWIVGLCLLALAWRESRLVALRTVGGAPVAAPGRREAWLVVTLLALAGALRLWDLDGFPTGVQADEAAFGLEALEILRGRAVHPFGFVFIGDPALFAYAEALLVAVFGLSAGSLRILAGLAGIGGLAALWLFARPLFGPFVAAVATALATVSAAHLHFSRMALNVIEIPLIGLFALALAWRGLLDGRALSHLLAGYVLGFSQFFHFGSRAFVLTAAATYAVTLLAHRRQWRQIVGGGLLALLGMLVVLAPQLAHVRDNPAELGDRFQFRSVFRRWDQATEIHGTDDPIGVMVGQVKINLLAFLNVPDRGPFYNFAQEPLLYWPVALLFMGGLILAIVRCRQARYATLLLVAGAVLAGGVLSAGAPQFHRLLPLVPVACLLAALCVEQLVCWLTWAGARAGWWSARVDRLALIALPGALVVATAVDGVGGVFVRHPALAPWQPQTAWARWAARQPPGSTVLLAGAPDVFAWDDRVRLLGAGVALLDVPNPSADLPPAGTRYPLAVALNPKLDDWIPVFEARLPGASFRPVLGPNGDLALLEAIIPAASDAPRGDVGLRGELIVEDRDRTIVEPRQDAAVAFREASRLSGGRPFRARWQGSLIVDVAGAHRLELYTDGAAELLVDGVTVVEGRTAPNPRSLRGEKRLAAGPHTLELRYGYVRGPGTLELRWQPPGQERTLIPPASLRPT